MNIRVTTDPKDVDERLFLLLEEFAREAGLEPATLDRGNFRALWGQMHATGTAFLVLMEDGDVLAGALGALVHPMVYWPWNGASETFWFVRAPFRKGMWPVRMMKEFEAEAKRRGCREVHAGHKVFFQAESMARLYKALGYSPRELLYRKGL